MASKIRHLSSDQFREACKGKKFLPPTVVVKSYKAEVEDNGVDGVDDSHILTFTISTGDVDRDGDTVSVDGWDLSDFNKSGVVLWAHNATLPPIAKPIETWVSGKALKSRAQFTPADMNHPLGDGFGHTVYRMFQGGYLRGVSVGFLPKTWKMSEDRDGERPIDFERQALLEFSAVPIPSNPSALLDAARKGIDITQVGKWCEMALDNEGTKLILTREAIDDVRKLTTGNPTTVQVPAAMVKHAITYDEAHPEGDPLAPMDEEWDGAMQIAEADTDKLWKMSAWVAIEEAEDKASYKLQHHRADDNYTVWDGVRSAMEALISGEVDIPADDRRSAYDHLARHYVEFEEEPPDFDDKTEGEEEVEGEAAAADGADEEEKVFAVVGDDGQINYEGLGSESIKEVSALIDEIAERIEHLEVRNLTDAERLALRKVGEAVKAMADPSIDEFEKLLSEIDANELKRVIEEQVHRQIIQPLTGELY